MYEGLSTLLIIRTSIIEKENECVENNQHIFIVEISIAADIFRFYF